MAENKLENAMNKLRQNVANTYSALYEMGADQPPVENSDNLPATARTVKAGGTGTGGGASIDVTAEVGQTIIVKAVDANGKPTAWESADYQPRTHWKTTTRKAILESTTVEYNADFGSMVLTEPIDLVVGNTYTVNWNGTEYTCTAYEVTMEITAVVLGDMYTASGGAVGTAPTGEPFVIMRAPDELAESAGIYAQIMSLEGLESVTLSISGNVVEYHHLDSRYIKDMYGSETGVILPETTAEIVQEQGMAMFMPNAPLVAGGEYTVGINGVEYVRTAVEASVGGNSVVAIGNLGALTGTSTGEDMFFIMSAFMPIDEDGNMANVIAAMDFTMPTTITLSIVGDKKIVKIPNKYIPQMDKTTVVYVTEDPIDQMSDGTYCEFDVPVETIYADVEAKKNVILVCEYSTKRFVYQLNGGKEGTYIFTCLQPKSDTLPVEITIMWIELTDSSARAYRKYAKSAS